MNRKLSALLLVLLTASCSSAAVSPEIAAQDPRIAPYIEFTRQNGASLLPGRYMHTQEIAQLGSTQKILAPTPLIFEVESLNPEENTYSVNADVWGEDLTPLYMALDFSGAVPMLRTYEMQNEGQYEAMGEDFAVVISDGTKHIWLLASPATGELNYLYPLTADWFPEGWYAGSWKRSDGAEYTFSEDGTASMNGQVIGKFIVSDNRIVLTRTDGEKEALYAARNPDDGNLVITFTNDDELTAGVFTRSQAPAKKPAPTFAPAKPKTPAPTFTPPQPKTEPSSTTQMPTQFPKMPDVKMPEPPAPKIDGVWGAYVNGQQWVVQYQGGQYFGWINGQPSEMGVVSLKGSTLTGRNNNGVNFTAEVELDGETLTLTFPNGNVIQYQKLQ